MGRALRIEYAGAWYIESHLSPAIEEIISVVAAYYKKDVSD
jgi:hypothetical protein